MENVSGWRGAGEREGGIRVQVNWKSLDPIHLQGNRKTGEF